MTQEGNSDPEVFDLAPSASPKRGARQKKAVPVIPITAESTEMVAASETPPIGPAGLAPVLNYDRQAPAAVRRLEDAFPEIEEPWRDLWIPAALVAIAFGLLVVVSWQSGNILTTLLAVGAFGLTKAFVMAIGVPAMTRFADVSFGRVSPALLKLAAVGLLPDAAAATVFHFADACSALLLSIPAGVITMWLVFRFVISFDASESIWCTVVLTFVTLVPYLLWLKLYWYTLVVAG